MKTKLPTPQRLPSGLYRCQVMVNGQRESVVDADPDKAQAKAVALKNGLLEKTKPIVALSVGESIDRYIESKDAVLSPATVAGYRRIRKNLLTGIMATPLSTLTQEKIQREINRMAKTHSPKTVRNAHGLLSATLAEYLPSMTLRTTLPQKQRYEAQIPSSEEIKVILSAARGTDMELPILLAVWLGLRMSEIRGLAWSCVGKSTIRVKQAIVDVDCVPTAKGTKTYSGDRTLRAPAYILELLQSQPKKGEYVVRLSGQAIYKRFVHLCEKAGLPHYRFHDLRHANASVMLALNVPDKYAMERMGHATNNMLKTVYQHTMKEKQDTVADLVDGYFATILEETTPTD